MASSLSISLKHGKRARFSEGRGGRRNYDLRRRLLRDRAGHLRHPDLRQDAHPGHHELRLPGDHRLRAYLRAFRHHPAFRQGEAAAAWALSCVPHSPTVGRDHSRNTHHIAGRSHSLNSHMFRIPHPGPHSLKESRLQPDRPRVEECASFFLSASHL